MIDTNSFYFEIQQHLTLFVFARIHRITSLLCPLCRYRWPGKTVDSGEKFPLHIPIDFRFTCNDTSLFHVKQRSDKLKPVRTITSVSRKTQSVCGLSEWKHIKDNSRRWNVRLLPSSIKQRLRKTETIFVISKEEQKWQRIVFKAYDIYALNSLSQRSRNAATLTPSQKYFHTAYSVSVTDGKLNLSISCETYRSIATQSRISLNMNSPPL